ncbi:MAG: hypothetical protein K2N94_09795, partial [Lachnospiraceae bacterium]|nr:hypothetical protein [Lachnospiraceae bacterium]
SVKRAGRGKERERKRKETDKKEARKKKEIEVRCGWLEGTENVIDVALWFTKKQTSDIIDSVSIIGSVRNRPAWMMAGKSAAARTEQIAKADWGE